MKKIRYCKITILILAGWAILSAIGFLGKDTIYSRYTVDPVKTPYFVLVMQGIHDGIYPWSSDHESLWDKWEHLAELRRDEEQISATESTEPAAEGTESVAVTETVAETEQEEVRSFHAVDAGYFSDAVFIGDSRTVGLQDYGDSYLQYMNPCSLGIVRFDGRGTVPYIVIRGQIFKYNSKSGTLDGADTK